MQRDKPGAVEPTHPCAREGPCPVVHFAVDERGGSILVYATHFNRHGEAYLTVRFYESRKSGVRPRRARRTHKGACLALRRCRRVSGHLGIFASKVKPFRWVLHATAYAEGPCQIHTSDRPASFQQKDKYFKANEILLFLSYIFNLTLCQHKK